MTIAIYSILIIVAVIIGTIILYHFINKAGEKGVMKDAALTLEQSVNDGYLGVPDDLKQYMGIEGIALTVLRPAGKIKINEKILDAVSYNDFINEGETVKVVKYENTQLYVLKVVKTKD